MTAPPDGGSAGGTRASGEPPRWWTLIFPSLLTLPVSAWALLLAAVVGLSSADGGPDPGPITAIGIALFIVGVVSIGVLVAGLAWRTGRRALRRVLWITCLLTCAGLGVEYALAAALP